MSLEFFPLVIDESTGLHYYNVPVGAKIYRGDTDAYLNGQNLQKMTYFAHNTQIANVYGVPATYSTTRELRLLALDKVENYVIFDTIDDAQFKKALKSSFNNGRSRDSDARSDKIVARKICELGYDGYATNEMPESGFDDDDISEGTFHAELMICNADEIVAFQKFLDQDMEKVAGHKRKHRQVLESRLRKKPAIRKSIASIQTQNQHVE